jgi:hypothetical protein
VKIVMKMTTLAAALAFSAVSLSAQNSGRTPRMRSLRSQPRPAQPQRRDALEQRFRERTEQVVRKRLNLNDNQVNRLRVVNADIGGKRDALVAQERSVRSGLRDEMSKGSGADQAKVSQMMAQARDLQARRFSLQQDEQRQLAAFMSPVQVAQYVGLQAQIRQRIREMQRDQGGGQPNPDQNP